MIRRAYNGANKLVARRVFDRMLTFSRGALDLKSLGTR